MSLLWAEGSLGSWIRIGGRGKVGKVLLIGGMCITNIPCLCAIVRKRVYRCREGQKIHCGCDWE